MRHARTALAALCVVSALFISTITSSASAVNSPRTTCTTVQPLSTWSLVQLANETVIVPFRATDLSQARNAALEGFGGIILFGSTGPANLKWRIAAMRLAVPRHAGFLVMTDDEGGGVWRMSNLVPWLPWARALGRQPDGIVEALARQRAKSMVKNGITVDLAPVLDIDGRNVEPGPTNADGYRSFSGHASVVEAKGIAFMRGLIEGGVLPVVKHFPGLGGVSPNTDYGGALTKPWLVVQKTSLAPFVAAIAAGAPAIMTSNAIVPGLSRLPASLSRAVITGELRNTLHFKGLIITDSLSAGAIHDAGLSVVAAGVAAVAAGADAVLFSVPSHGTAVGLANSISHAIVRAVQRHQISKATLIAAAQRVVAAQGANICL